LARRQWGRAFGNIALVAEMNSLFSTRAGVAVFGDVTSCRADWPLGKVTVDAEAITIDALFSSYRLPLAGVDCLRPGLLTVRVKHHAPGVPPRVRIWGLRLFRRLREVIHRHALRVERGFALRTLEGWFCFGFRFCSSSEHLSWCRREFSLPFSDAVASFLKIVAEGVQPNNPAVSLKPGELPSAELADGCSELKSQVVECPQLSAEIPRYIAVL
jgi:hypothetical protein